MRSPCVLSAAALAALAGHALAQPTIDGSRDNAFYGTTPLWVQTQPTSFGDNLPSTPCDNNQIGNPGAVTTGIEIAIPLSAIGNPATGDIRIAGFVISQGHDYVSNQTIGGVPVSQTASFGEPRSLNFGSVTGNQFVSGITVSGTAPAIDGTKDAAYGAPLFTQTVRTSFGDNNTNPPAVDVSNGSEIDALYAVVSGGTLYVMITGNLESNFNKLDLFFDTNPAVGQNRLLGTNPDVDFNGLNRLGEEGTNGNGLTFDAGFAADYYMTFTGGGSPYALYANYAQLRDVAAAGDPGVGYYLGTGTAASNGTLTGGGAGAPAISVTINNSNVAGVPGVCPPPTGNPDFSAGSEIDGLYGKVQGGKLYLLVTGNLQTNFNKLDLFLDVAPGGQNQIRGNNPDVDFNGLNRMGNDGSGNGLKFDAGFEADYWIGFTNGNTPVQVFSNCSVLRTDGRLLTASQAGSLDYGCYDGGNKTSFNPITFSGPRIDPQDGFTPNIFANYAPRKSTENLMAVPAGSPPSTTSPNNLPGLLKLSINNSNVGGVTSTTATPPSVSDAINVTTGLELELDLAELGWSGGPIKVAGFINAGGHDFLSNQVIGGLPDATQPGDPRAVDFTALAGTQHVTIGGGQACYANCDSSTTLPFLNVADFTCFLNKYAAGGTYANCDGSTQAPVLNVADFTCFLNKFAAGCSAP
jgi:hypothetical protein